jgi:hypothetical protein
MAAIQSIKTVLGFFKGLMTLYTPPIPINKEIIRKGVPINKTGISPSRVYNEIKTRKTQAGVPNVPSEEDLRMERIRVEAILNELIANAKVDIVIPPNALQVTVYAGVPGQSPPIGIGVNDTPPFATIKGYGIIR